MIELAVVGLPPPERQGNIFFLSFLFVRLFSFSLSSHKLIRHYLIPIELSLPQVPYFSSVRLHVSGHLKMKVSI